jgi:glycosyltransferase involved in cell wall biosynthesis
LKQSDDAIGSVRSFRGSPEFPSLSIHCIALLGRKDEPTDAIEEYCRYLGSALQVHNFQFEIRRVAWEVHGWSDALHALKLQAERWRGTSVLVQYTALAWSLRGFPRRVLRVLKVLKSAGARLGIVFHDVEPFPGSRPIDSIRRTLQICTMSRVLSLADFAVFTVPLEKISWLAALPPNATFIPVGPNLPIPWPPVVGSGRQNIPIIGVFSITGGQQGARETELILGAVRHASQALGKLRLSVFGRHAELREADLRTGLKNLPVELSVEGVAKPEQIVQKLSECDVLLFVRGGISSRRGSAIAGIACGLPVVAFSGSETAPPITDAGVVLLPSDQPIQLNAALVRVLSDRDYRDDLAARSRTAYQSHFAWPIIAARFADLFDRVA